MLRKERDWETFSFQFSASWGFFSVVSSFHFIQGRRKKKIKKNHPHFDAAK